MCNPVITSSKGVQQGKILYMRERIRVKNTRIILSFSDVKKGKENINTFCHLFSVLLLFMRYHVLLPMLCITLDMLLTVCVNTVSLIVQMNTTGKKT